MKRFIKLIVFVCVLLSFFVITTNDANAYSYLADKAETPVKLENTGARAICQTDDGCVWIGQFAGLSRYDSKNLTLFNTIVDEKGETQELENVRCLAQYRNTLFFVSSIGLVKYDNYKFSEIEIEKDVNLTINSIIFDDYGKLYISTTNGLYTLTVKTNKLEKVSEKTDSILGVAINDKEYYYFTLTGLYKSDDTLIYESSFINQVYCYTDNDNNNIMAIANKDSKIYFYDIKNNKMLDNVIEFKGTNGKKVSGEMAHKFVYSSENNTLFASGEKGLWSIDAKTFKELQASNLENSTKLVDIMIDYEGNLWIASYITGVSFISKSQLIDIMFDVETSTMPESSRLIYAIEKYGDYLYLATNGGIYVYNTLTQSIDNSHPLVTKINEIMEYDKKQHDAWDAAYKEWKEQKELDPTIPDFDEPEPEIRIKYYDIRDVEIFKNKIYFASYGSGLFEYNPETEDFILHQGDEIWPADPSPATNYFTVAQRCLRSYGDYLIIGTTDGKKSSLIKYDGTSFLYQDDLKVNGQVLYINKSVFGEITYVTSANGIYSISSTMDVDSIKIVPGIEQGTSGILKFYQDGNNFYYNIYGRFFNIKTTQTSSAHLDASEPEEIKIPFVNGSITEIAKVKINDSRKGETYKYVLASEKQIYIIDDLNSDTLNYEYFDSSNGLKSSIKGNSSGFYDENNQIYYFQSQNGIFAYDFENVETKREALKIDVYSVQIDDKAYHGNNVKIDKDAERITFNVSVYSFKPSKGYQIYYKLDGVDKQYIKADDNLTSVSYTNLKGGNYKFHIYVLDELDQMSNQIDITLTKTKKFHEHITFIILVVLLSLFVIVGSVVFYFRRKIKQSIKRQLEYKKITLESIEAIARTIDAKDTYTNGHSRRVGYYSREIAKEMGLPEKEVENIFYTALLHDIGKIGIPNKIINKPARLDDEEFEIMKTHTTKGGKILKDISTIPGIVEGAMYHHEKWNGSGYPTGLKGEEIPLNARIICCADCFDAMATKRSYKEPCSKEYIINEFKRCSGTQFDPEIAKVMVKLVEEDRFKTMLEEDKNKKNDVESENKDSKDGE